jgi:pyruvate/2-oxoglutarate dehydrogenase complex dihydrolipoamide dehydrogenase (E3) component
MVAQVTNEKFDIAVIGAGSGGLSVAAAAAQFGERVVLFEKGEMGGDCLNTGCVPSKALLAAAKKTHASKGASKESRQRAFEDAMDHVHRTIATIAPHDSQQRFEGLGVVVVRAKATFKDRETLTANGTDYRARRIVIATGSRAAVPPIPGIETVHAFTNESIFENRTLPDHLLIIGAGPIGLEMAQAHRRLGAEVTVLEGDLPLAKDDPDLTAIVLQSLKSEGITIHANAAISSIGKSAAGITITLKDGRLVTGSHLLVAAGRSANVEGLNLEAASIAYTKRGITVDQALRTSNRKVYAIGDVAGGLQFTHVAGYHAGLVIRNALFRLPVKNRTDIIPWVTYTDPELAHVGLSEAAAREQNDTNVKVLRWPFKDNDRAVAEGKTDGLVKIITGKRGVILGASIVGPNAGELIAPWVLAVNRKLKISALANIVFPYPTMAEAGKRAAVTYYAGMAQKPFIRRVIGALKVFG